MNRVTPGRRVEGRKLHRFGELPGLERHNRVADPDFTGFVLLHFRRKDAHVLEGELRRRERLDGPAALEFEEKAQRFPGFGLLAVEAAGEGPPAEQSEIDGILRRRGQRLDLDCARGAGFDLVGRVFDIGEREAEAEAETRAAALFVRQRDRKRQARLRLDLPGLQRAHDRVEVETDKAFPVLDGLADVRFREVAGAAVGPLVAA